MLSTIIVEGTGCTGVAGSKVGTGITDIGGFIVVTGFNTDGFNWETGIFSVFVLFERPGNLAEKSDEYPFAGIPDVPDEGIEIVVTGCEDGTGVSILVVIFVVLDWKYAFAAVPGV
jgi:hypothetical protein